MKQVSAPKKSVRGKSSGKKSGARVVAQNMQKTVEIHTKQPVGPVAPKKPTLVTPKNPSSRQYTQSELFDSIRGFCGFMTRSQAKEFYGSFVEMIQGALKNGYKLMLPGLGKLQIRKTKARMGRNPATQQPIMIPAKRKVAFTPLKALKEAVL